MTKEKRREYIDLFGMTYDEAINYLLEKYGPAEDDYYSEKSYKRLLAGEIKNMNKKKKISRTSEGLYCHHIKEDRAINLSNLDFIRYYKHPYEYHLKHELVYCDLVEHMILHALITIENKTPEIPYGIGGYYNFLAPQVIEWYIEGQAPSPQWMKNCYEKAFLSKESAKKILSLTFVSIEYYLAENNL